MKLNNNDFKRLESMANISIAKIAYTKGVICVNAEEVLSMIREIKSLRINKYKMKKTMQKLKEINKKNNEIIKKLNTEVGK